MKLPRRCKAGGRPEFPPNFRSRGLRTGGKLAPWRPVSLPFSGFSVLALVVLALAWPAAAQELSDGDRAAIRDVISRQVEAFRRDDGEAAFGSPRPTSAACSARPDTFMDMVRQGYQPVYRPRVFDFGEIVDAERPADPEGPCRRSRRPAGDAFYPMTRCPTEAGASTAAICRRRKNTRPDRVT